MIYDYVTTKPPLNDETLAHYGIIGMKWGVRKDPEKAFRKASDKLERLKKKAGLKSQKRVYKANKRANKYNKKSLKATNKYLKALNKTFVSKDTLNELMVNKDRAQAKAANAQIKANKAVANAAKANKKQVNWERAIQKTFTSEYNRIKKTSQTDEEKDLKLKKLDDAYMNAILKKKKK